MTNAITISGLKKSYGAFEAVKGIDLSVKRGEVFALLGPNGAGKTTTVEILEGYRERNAGDVEVLGEDPARPTRDWRSRIGIVLQSNDDNSPLSVREYLTHMAKIFPKPRDVDEVIAAIGLQEKENARPKQLSGGQRRRLDVGLGIIGDPELLFLDEPTTGFDPEARREFWKLINSLRDGGTTIVLTTHYLDEAEALSDRLAIIAGGRIVAQDTAAGLRARAKLTHVLWDEGGRRKEEATAEPTKLVRELLKNHKGEVPGLEIRRPTLEDVYLELIGVDRSASEAEGVAA